VNKTGKVELVAKWEDDIPAIAIRYDTPGLITSLGFHIGSNQTCINFVINAISLDR
jgi:hypothetical protein